MNPRGGQGRPKQDRRPRQMRAISNRNVVVPGNQPLQVYPNQQFAAPGNRLMASMENVIMPDLNAVLPVDVHRQNQSQQPQFLNMDRSVVRQPQAIQSRNVQILQNISVRTPVSGGARINVADANDASNRRFQQSQAVQNTIYATPMNTNAQMTTGPFRPGGQFLVFSRNHGPGEVGPGGAASAVGGPVSVLQVPPNRGQYVTSGPLAVATQQQGRLPMTSLDDYPPYSCIIYGFNNVHKNGMYRMGPLLSEMFNPLFSNSAYMLVLSVSYTQFICVEVEADIFGEFMCRLIPRLLETRQIPFVLEVRDAPCNWAAEYKKSIVVSKNNLSAARRIAESLKDRDVILSESEKLPDMLNAKFIARRSYLNVSFSVASDKSGSLFGDVKRFFIFSKTKDATRPDASTQTDMCMSTPKRLYEQHVLLADLVGNHLAKSNYRFAVQEEHLRKLNEMDCKQTGLLNRMEEQAGNLAEMREREQKTRAMEEYDWANCRSTEAQTDDSYAEPNPIRHTSLEKITEDYRSIISKVVEFSAKHYQHVQLGIQKMEKEIAKAKNDLKRRSRSHRDGGRKKEDKDREKPEEKKELKEEDDKSQVLKECNKEKDSREGIKDYKEIEIKEEKDNDDTISSSSKMRHDSLSSSSSRKHEKRDEHDRKSRASTSDDAELSANVQPRMVEYMEGYKNILVKMEMPKVVIEDLNTLMTQNISYSALTYNGTDVPIEIGTTDIINFDDTELFQDLHDGASNLQAELDSFYPFHSDYLAAPSMEQC